MGGGGCTMYGPCMAAREIFDCLIGHYTADTTVVGPRHCMGVWRSRWCLLLASERSPAGACLPNSSSCSSVSLVISSIAFRVSACFCRLLICTRGLAFTFQSSRPVSEDANVGNAGPIGTCCSACCCFKHAAWPRALTFGVHTGETPAMVPHIAKAKVTMVPKVELACQWNVRFEVPIHGAGAVPSTCLFRQLQLLPLHDLAYGRHYNNNTIKLKQTYSDWTWSRRAFIV
jgi:hypothetical protein